MSQLSDLAASLSAGEWGQLNAAEDGSGYGDELLRGDDNTGVGVGSVFAFQARITYDPIRDKVWHQGAPHVSSGSVRNQVTRYDVATNVWSWAYIDVPGVVGAAHAYESNAVNLNTRQFYSSGKLELDTFFKIGLDTDPVDDDAPPAIATATGAEGEPSLTYFPERGEMVLLQGNTLSRYNEEANTWTVVSGSSSSTALNAGSANGIGIRNPTLIYSQSNHCLIGMGGTEETSPGVFLQKKNVFRYNADGSFTSLTQVPSSIWIMSGTYVAAADPVSGKIIVLTGVQNGNWQTWTGDYELWEFDPSGSGTWTELSNANVPDPDIWWSILGNNKGPESLVATPIHRYGVIMFASAGLNAGGGLFVGKVFLYKHTNSSAPNYTFTEKVNSQPGILGAYDFDSSSDVRAYPVASAFPLKYGGWGGAGPCASAGLGTEYVSTPDRNSGTPLGADELNAHTEVQDGVCYYPTIDTSMKFSGSGSLRIEVPAKSSQTTGGWFDSTFAGMDQPHVRVGPDTNGGIVWHQFRYRSQNMAQNDFNGAFPNTFTKIQIFGSVPPGLEFLGTDSTLASVFHFASGWGGNRNGLFQSYTRGNCTPLPSCQGPVENTERTVGAEIHLQTAVMCVYQGATPGDNYSYPPCVRLVDNQWFEITRMFRLRPVASDFSVSGTTLTRSTNTFTSGMVDRYVYIAGDGYYKITAFTDANNITLASAPTAGSNKAVYISGYANSIMKEWVDGQLVIDVSDQVMVWNAAPPAGWGEFRLLAQQTARNSSITATAGTVWYDDYIVSNYPIPFGATGATQEGGPTPAPYRRRFAHSVRMGNVK